MLFLKLLKTNFWYFEVMTNFSEEDEDLFFSQSDMFYIFLFGLTLEILLTYLTHKSFF